MARLYGRLEAAAFGDVVLDVDNIVPLPAFWPATAAHGCANEVTGGGGTDGGLDGLSTLSLTSFQAFFGSTGAGGRAVGDGSTEGDDNE